LLLLCGSTRMKSRGDRKTPQMKKWYDVCLCVCLCPLGLTPCLRVSPPCLLCLCFMIQVEDALFSIIDRIEQQETADKRALAAARKAETRAAWHTASM
jgi:hypothetical protein